MTDIPAYAPVALTVIAFVFALIALWWWLTDTKSDFQPDPRLPGLRMVIHDLAKSIENIQFRLQEIESTSIEEEARRHQLQEFIGEDVRFLDHTTHNLKLLLQQNEPDSPVKRERVDMRALCEEVRDLLTERARRRGVRLVYEGAARLPAVAADRYQIQRVLINLVENGIKFAGKENPTVVMRMHADKTKLVLEISDNGRGIPKELLDTIWGHRLRDADTIDIDGAGLGLLIVQQIVRQHDGKITVSSKPGLTIFTIELPLKTASSEQKSLPSYYDLQETS
jgi:signal transduction histidine kinase